MNFSRIVPFALIALLHFIPTVSSTGQDKTEEGFVDLFNGKNLDGWQRVNTAKSTWSIKDNMLLCTGKPIGELRTTKMYQNFILEVEWRHMKPKGNAGIFVWADDITAKGVPFHRSIEVQVLENAYGNGGGHTVHGDIFPIHGAKMTPINGRGGGRAFPTENRSKPSPNWNHYRIECRDGAISLAVNGKVVTQGKKCSPSKGYICIESEGGIVHYRNMRIKVLPDTQVKKENIAIADRGFKCLYDGIDLHQWKVKGKWSPNDWRLNHQSDEQGSITTHQSYENSSFIADFHSGPKMPHFEFRGVTIAPSQFDKKLLAKGTGWNRIQIDCSKQMISATVNGKLALPPTQANPSQGPLKVVANGKSEIANLYVKE